ncbi:MAG: NYN domain-containing protein [Acidobacteria bacterium]|nr:NYN domain-containing protein [Acidobacteriota bacterium]
MVEDRLKIAVFIDFDNIEIGVKSTLNRHFDIGAVLEAIKERGEVVTKIAYGDWKRAGEHSRSMTQHAIQMVQRNLTPGGDKNGADINLALDALEMAFTRNHINAFVIVGGDSDFIALVEKLKQYDKKVFVVGGRAFTSIILQKNCHEFISYENLIAPQGGPRRQAEKTRTGAAVTDANLAKAFPLVRRALKVVADREVSPQLGLLKSTLLQLDSTFSERDYGASTFRDFIEKMASAGYVKLKQVDRSLLVELKDQMQAEQAEPEKETAFAPAPAPAPAPEALAPTNGQSTMPSGPTPAQADEAIRAMQEAFQNSKVTPHWPMYLRNVKQFIKSSAPAFDEHRYGFRSFLEAMRSAQRAGLFRMERNRQGILRVFPGNQISQLQRPSGLPGEETPVREQRAVPYDVENDVVQEQLPVREAEPRPGLETAPFETPPPEAVETQPETGEFTLEAPAPAGEDKPARKRRASSGIKRKTVAPRKPAGAAVKRTRKKASPPEEGSAG